MTHTPGWPTIPEQVKLADATPVIVRTQPADDFCLTRTPFSRRSRRARSGIVINSPGNPTGALMSEEDLAAIADEAAKRGIWILLDLVLRAADLR